MEMEIGAVHGDRTSRWRRRSDQTTEITLVDGDHTMEMEVFGDQRMRITKEEKALCSRLAFIAVVGWH